MDNNENNLNQNEQNNTGAEKTAPWFLKKDDTVIEADYNPYRENVSVLAEVYEENKEYLNGPSPLNTENPLEYEYRMAIECSILKQGVSKRMKKDSSFVALLIFAALMMMQFFASAFLELGNVLPYEVFSVLYYVYLILQYVIILPPIFYIATLGKKNKVRTYFKKPKVSAFYIARWSVIALGAVYVVTIFSDMLFAYLRSNNVYVSEFAYPIPGHPIELALYFFCVVICAPILEEILFRGIILSRLMRYGGWFAVISTALLFGAYHQNHEQFFFAITIGLILAIIDINAGSIIPSVIAHAIINAYSYLSIYVLSFTNYNLTTIDPTLKLDGPVWAILATVLLDILLYAIMVVSVITFIVEIVKNNKQFKLPDPKCGLSTGEKTISFFFTWPMLGVLSVLALYMAFNSFIDFEALFSMLE